MDITLNLHHDERLVATRIGDVNPRAGYGYLRADLGPIAYVHDGQARTNSSACLIVDGPQARYLAARLLDLADMIDAGESPHRETTYTVAPGVEVSA